MKKRVYVICVDGVLDGVFTDLYLTMKRCDELQDLLFGTSAKKIQVHKRCLNCGTIILKNEE